MSGLEPRPSDRSNDPANDTVSRWLRLAGPRPDAPREYREAARASVRSHWLRLVAKRRRRRLAIAAGVLVAAAAGLWWRAANTPQASSPVPSPGAVVAAVQGEVHWRSTDGRSRLAVGDRVAAGGVISTGATGGAALAFERGATLRLAATTRLRWLGRRHAVLESGAVYVDTPAGSAAADGWTIDTPFGSAREIGTQFEVRLDPDGYRVRVREGRVVVEHAQTEATREAAAGDELRWHVDDGFERRRIALFGEPWEWTLAVAPTADLDGWTLAEVVRWMERETGWTVRYESAATRRTLADDTLHGTLRDVRADQVPARALPAFGLESRLEDGVLTVAER